MPYQIIIVFNFFVVICKIIRSNIFDIDGTRFLYIWIVMFCWGMWYAIFLRVILLCHLYNTSRSNSYQIIGILRSYCSLPSFYFVTQLYNYMYSLYSIVFRAPFHLSAANGRSRCSPGPIRVRWAWAEWDDCTNNWRHLWRPCHKGHMGWNGDATTKFKNNATPWPQWVVCIIKETNMWWNGDARATFKNNATPWPWKAQST